MRTIPQFMKSIAWLATVAFVAGCCCCGTPQPPSNGVQIQVNVNSLSDAEIEDLKAKLAAIAGDDANITTVFNGQATWNYPTDLEPQAFADQIDFATVTSVQDRIITISVTAPPAEDPTDIEPADGADASADATTDDGTDNGTSDASAADADTGTNGNGDAEGN